jgi:Transmembrane secretion effector
MPQLVSEDASGGPIMVSVEYWPRGGLEDGLLQALHDARWSRRHTGAVSWRVWRDSAEPRRFVEQFVVASWQEHLRQHERISVRDQERLERIRAMTEPDKPAVVTHWIAPRQPL